MLCFTYPAAVCAVRGLWGPDTHSPRTLRFITDMVYAVLLPQGLSHKGSGQVFKREILFQTMVRECCEWCNHCEWCENRGNIVTIAYCDDGFPKDDWNHHSLDTTKQPVDLKVLRDLVKFHLSTKDMEIRMVKFSFASADASQILSLADVFYFKGFGGDISRLRPMLQKPFPSIIQEFQNRVVLNWPRPLLTIQVCGGAIIMGRTFYQHTELDCMEIFGPASLRYFPCETMTQERLEAREMAPYDIPMAPGVGILIKLKPGTTYSVRCVTIAKSERPKYESFRRASFGHADRVLAALSCHWKLHQYKDELGNTRFWAVRIDGAAVIGYFDPQSVIVAIQRAYPGEVIQWW